MRAQPARVVEQRAHELRHVVEVELAHHDRAARPDEVRGVQRLVVVGRERVGNEDRRLARGCDLPDRRAGAREDEIDGRERGAEAVGLGQDTVVGPCDLAPHEVVVAPARRCAGSPARREPTSRRRTRSARARRRARRTRRGCGRRDRARRSRVPPRGRSAATAPGSGARHLVFRPRAAAVGRVGEEDSLRERRGEPVGEPEVRVGLGERRRDPHRSARRAPSARRRTRRRRARRPGGGAAGSTGMPAAPRPPGGARAGAPATASAGSR